MKQIEQMITTVEIAEMMGISHKNILRKIEGNGSVKGILSVLTERNFAPSEFFIESKYKDASGKENKCYNCTRMGCEFLAHKFQGERGIEFTARYIQRFHQMEQILQQASTLTRQEPAPPSRIFPEFRGDFKEEKRIAAEFIQDYIAANNSDTGLYNACAN